MQQQEMTIMMQRLKTTLPVCEEGKPLYHLKTDEVYISALFVAKNRTRRFSLMMVNGLSLVDALSGAYMQGLHDASLLKDEKKSTRPESPPPPPVKPYGVEQ